MFYFHQGSENCYELSYHRQYMIDNNIASLELFEAVRETDTGYFYCKEFDLCGEVGNCGKMCDKYKPNNGKNGRCKHYGYVYEQSEKSITIYNE